MLIVKGKPQRFPEICGKLETIRYPVYVEEKLDGATNWLVIPSIYDPELDGIEGPYLINGNGKIITDLPITREIEMLANPYRLLGELHYRDGRAGDFYKLKGADDDDLKFTIFDVDVPLPYSERRKWIIENIKTSRHIRIVLGVMALNKEQVLEVYNSIIKLGMEGAVVKSFDSRLIMGPCPWVKLKKTETLDLKVALINSNQERIEVLHGNIRVGVKCLNKYKNDLKVGDIVEIEHRGILEGGSLRSPVFLRKRDDKCAS